jgi:hypothetical protein
LVTTKKAGSLVLTDADGKPIGDGKHHLSPGQDARLVACRLVRAQTGLFEIHAEHLRVIGKTTSCFPNSRDFRRAESARSVPLT